jgi:hypothetical protein
MVCPKSEPRIKTDFGRYAVPVQEFNAATIGRRMTRITKFLTGSDLANDDLACRKRLQARPSIIDCQRPSFDKRRPPFGSQPGAAHHTDGMPGKPLARIGLVDTYSKQASTRGTAILRSFQLLRVLMIDPSRVAIRIYAVVSQWPTRKRSSMYYCVRINPGSLIFTNTFRSSLEEAAGTPSLGGVASRTQLSRSLL